MKPDFNKDIFGNRASSIPEEATTQLWVRVNYYTEGTQNRDLSINNLSINTHFTDEFKCRTEFTIDHAKIINDIYERITKPNYITNINDVNNIIKQIWNMPINKIFEKDFKETKMQIDEILEILDSKINTLHNNQKINEKDYTNTESKINSIRELMTTEKVNPIHDNDKRKKKPGPSLSLRI